MASKRRFSYRWRLFIPILGMMWLIVGSLMTYQYYHERKYRVESITDQLNTLSNRILDAYERDVNLWPFLNFITQFFDNSKFDQVMVSVYDREGSLLYSVGSPIPLELTDTKGLVSADEFDSVSADQYHSLFKVGSRRSSNGEILVQTAMPITVSLYDYLNSGPDFWFLLVFLLAVSAIMAYLSTGFLTRNIQLLRKFASATAEKDAVFDESKFPHDELGDISREIVKIYRAKEQAMDRSKREHELAMYAVEEKSRIKRQLTNNINHEIKTPIGVIRGYLDTVISSPDMDDALRNQFLLRAQSNVNRLCSLLSDVSIMTRLEEGAGNIPTAEVDFHDLVYGVENDVTASGVLGDMTFHYDVPMDCSVKGNANLLTGMLTNLIRNSVQYSHGTEIGLVFVSESERYYTFSFYDNGTGVPDEHLIHLFERFYRVDAGRSRKVGGTGLGLPIVKNTVEALGGTISVRNRTTGGLEFLFTLEKWRRGKGFKA
ncbi:MAG: HAMP domain-containing histidine kinase [Muribaculaceae bacterium]|nr:HAMP domain-containing histidine kinase [Muribaculaceae bacterium]